MIDDHIVIAHGKVVRALWIVREAIFTLTKTGTMKTIEAEGIGVEIDIGQCMNLRCDIIIFFVSFKPKTFIPSQLFFPR
jgi:hypothetical protein